jgi:hypothetical protein
MFIGENLSYEVILNPGLKPDFCSHPGTAGSNTGNCAPGICRSEISEP